MSAQGQSGGDRYEPLPSIPELPRYVWRRLPRWGRVGLALLPVAIVVAAILLAPGINDSKDQQRQADAQRRAQNHAELVRHLRAEQRPRLARGTGLATLDAPPAAQLAGRRQLLAQADARILADARERGLKGPIRRVECEPYPRTLAANGAEGDLNRRYGRYECLAVTADVKRTSVSGTGIIGHPYRLQIDFKTGRYGFCKISGRAGEGSIAHSTPIIGVPTACGGG